MKNILLLSVLCFLGFTTTLFAQIKLGDNPTVLQPSAVLEMESNSKGMLMPRMTAAQKEAIVAPAAGLTIYQTDGDTGFWYYDGTQWRKASLPSGTQTGDMMYWNGNTWMLLPSGQQGQPLVYCNGVPQWGACAPTVTTLAVTNIGIEQANLSGVISFDGGSIVLTRGFCWSTNPNPTTANNNTPVPGVLSNFQVGINNLSASTTYYVRAYAENSAGLMYGNEISFTTLPATIATGLSATVSNIGSVTAQFQGSVVFDGGSMITERGICWSLNSTPTTNDQVINTGSGEGAFSGNINGLTPGALYYVRPYAVNAVGTAYGPELSFTTLDYPMVATTTPSNITITSARIGCTLIGNGGSPLTELGVCWSTNPNPSTADTKVNTANFNNGTYTFDLTSLIPATTYYVRAYAINAVGTIYGAEENFTTLPPQLPSISTTALSSITATTAQSGGNVTTDGGAAVTARGVCWSTSPNPTIADTKTVNGTGTGVFSSSITGLNQNTTYYVRAYATNSVGTVYGGELSITTLTLPILSTSIVYNILATTASSGGTVVSDGGSFVNNRGICWSINPSPTINNSVQSAGSGLGSFSLDMTSLTPNTTYYLRAFATTAAGTAYGNEQTFSTITPYLPVVITSDVVNITSDQAATVGIVTSIGTAQLLQSGVCWNSIPNPTISNFKVNTGAQIGGFYASMYNLLPATTYYVRAYATNIAGTAYGAELTFTTQGAPPILSTNNPTNITATSAVTGGVVVNNGGFTLTEKGICWSANNVPSYYDNHTNEGAGDAPFTSTLSNLSPGTTYFVRAYGKSYSDYGYGNLHTITTQVTAPEITTTVPYSVTQVAATSGGNISSDGGSPVTARGVCWSTTPIPTVSDNKTEDGSGAGYYTSSLTGLNSGETYYVRAYATNGAGTTYGAEYNFTIPPPTIPAVITNPVGNIVVTSATGFGQVNSDGAVAIITRGICWSTSPNPTINDSKSENNGGVGSFAESITGLTAGTAYYVRAFATNSIGTAYGNEISFQTLLPVSVTTNLTTNVTATNANSGGVITSDGGNPVTDRGVCWSTSPNPTYNGSERTYEGGGTGPFSSALSNLQQGNTYYVRAFGITAAGPGYGQEETFITTIPVLATLSTNPISNIYTYYAYGGGNITNDGGATITERGLCWSTTPNPTIADYRNNYGGGSGFFDFYFNGLSSGTFYYVRAYATSIAGTAYGEERTFTTLGAAPTLTTNIISSIAATTAVSGGIITNNGGADIGSKGVIWSSSNIPYIYSYQGITSEGTGSTPFTSTLTNLSPGTTYYVRAYAANNGETGYGNLYTFTTTYNVPSVATSLVSNIDQTSANGGGNVTNNGGQNVSERGVCWSTSPSPTINDNKLAIGAGNGGFSGSMTGLTLGVTYYVRAYATNSVGTGYGAQVSFTTAVTYATVSTDPISNISATTATGGGNVSSQGGSAVTARGVCWSVNPDPTLFNSKTINGSGTGTFSSSLSNLLPGKTYYVRAYAINSAGTAYGQPQGFTTTTTLPTLTGKPVIYITLSSAQSGGNITNDGGANITERGVCWSTSPNPNTSNSKTIDGTGSGDFTSMPTGLSPLTTYYLRPYATNNVGTAYGTEIMFKTTNFPVAIGQAYQGGIICYIDSTGEHGLIISNGSIGYAQYGCENTQTGASGIVIGTGAVNTGAILQNCNETFSAAKICDDYSVVDGGIVFDDWFLPSLDEIITLYPGLYLNNLGGFSNSYYIFSSSSEYSNASSWYYQIQNYNNNIYATPGATDKNNSFDVRAMRYF